ncbi:MAG: histidine kinase [Proteobacteria bacterium]|nr:sensor histidine kinase [Pseudomonadota bacterium]NOG60430.1 histidine kinase [Pseudomonadota bacterium]
MSKLDNQDKSSFLPDFCSVEVLFIVVLSAELLAIILSLALPIYSRDILFDLAMNSLFVQWISLSCVGLLCILRNYFATLSEKRAATLCYLIILLVAFIISELAWWSLYVYPNTMTPVENFHALFLLRSIGISAIVGAIVLRYLYVQHQWRKNIEAMATSRYQALQSRIRPHFLFNCMNTIASLTRKSPELAEQSVEDLADLFRASLLEPTELYKISEEWKLCQHYLRIEKHRLGDRLQLKWNIETLPEDALVPPLSLQPLLENAIYHGIERLPEGGTIEIKGTINGDSYRLTFTNPVPPANIEDTHKGNKHAQENIRLRLDTIFGQESNLTFNQTDEHYIVELTLPYKRYENTNR